MLPKGIIQVIQRNLRIIYNDIPTDDILIDLLENQVITDNEVSKIKKINEDRDKNFELIKILKTRGTRDFFQYCYALKAHETKNVQELGNLLENEANKALRGEDITDNPNIQGCTSFMK